MSLLLSVVIITLNEEQNLGRTLASVQPLVADGQGEIIVVDSGSTDRTVEIARSFGAKVFVEPWKGFAAQKNSAIEKAAGEWVLSLDADEEVSNELADEILDLFAEWGNVRKYFGWRENRESRRRTRTAVKERSGDNEGGTCVGLFGFRVPRRNHFLGRWVKHGGFWPDHKLRLFPRGSGGVPARPVHEVIEFDGLSLKLKHPLIHHAYPTLEVYLEHMRRYADLGAEMIKDKPRWWLWLNRWFNPPLTFFYNYVVRLGFLDGREGYLLHWNHRRYVGWKYARALELSRKPSSATDSHG